MKNNDVIDCDKYLFVILENDCKNITATVDI